MFPPSKTVATEAYYKCRIPLSSQSLSIHRQDQEDAKVETGKRTWKRNLPKAGFSGILSGSSYKSHYLFSFMSAWPNLSPF